MRGREKLCTLLVGALPFLFYFYLFHFISIFCSSSWIVTFSKLTFVTLQFMVLATWAFRCHAPDIIVNYCQLFCSTIYSITALQRRINISIHLFLKKKKQNKKHHFEPPQYHLHISISSIISNISISKTISIMNISISSIISVSAK